MTNSTTFLEDKASAQSSAVSGDQTDAQQNVTPQAESSDSSLAQLVGNDKKFTDVEALAKSKVDADNHIAQLEEENKSFRDQISQMDNNYEAILAKLDTQPNQSVSPEDHDADIEVDIEDLDKVIEARLTAREQKQLHAANAKESWDSLDKVYGDRARASEAIKELLIEKPYMQSVIEDLGKTNPKALVQEILNFKEATNIGNDAIDPTGELVSVTVNDAESAITWKDANKIRRTDVKQYNSPEFKALMEKSRQYYEAQGKDYYTTT